MVNKGRYRAPWSRQKLLRKKYSAEEVPDIEELSLMIGDIEFGKVNVPLQTMRAKALFSTYYLTAARASEIVKCKKLRKQETLNEEISYWYEDHGYQGIKKKHIKFDKIDGKSCMFLRTENRKNNYRKTKRQPIPIDFEKRIASFIYVYLKKLKDDELLFPFGDKRATQIINETTGFNIHFIRHIRATHLITLYDFNEQSLVKFMGWTDSRPARHYMELKSSDIFREFYKNKR